jgi:hypothetical protein
MLFPQFISSIFDRDMKKTKKYSPKTVVIPVGSLVVRPKKRKAFRKTVSTVAKNVVAFLNFDPGGWTTDGTAISLSVNAQLVADISYNRESVAKEVGPIVITPELVSGANDIYVSGTVERLFIGGGASSSARVRILADAATLIDNNYTPPGQPNAGPVMSVLVIDDHYKITLDT